jgi:hypothetical protein
MALIDAGRGDEVPAIARDFIGVERSIIRAKLRPLEREWPSQRRFAIWCSAVGIGAWLAVTTNGEEGLVALAAVLATVGAVVAVGAGVWNVLNRRALTRAERDCLLADLHWWKPSAVAAERERLLRREFLGLRRRRFDPTAESKI